MILASRRAKQDLLAVGRPRQQIHDLRGMKLAGSPALARHEPDGPFPGAIGHEGDLAAVGRKRGLSSRAFPVVSGRAPVPSAAPIQRLRFPERAELQTSRSPAGERSGSMSPRLAPESRFGAAAPSSVYWKRARRESRSVAATRLPSAETRGSTYSPAPTVRRSRASGPGKPPQADLGRVRIGRVEEAVSVRHGRRKNREPGRGDDAFGSSSGRGDAPDFGRFSQKGGDRVMEVDEASVGRPRRLVRVVGRAVDLLLVAAVRVADDDGVAASSTGPHERDAPAVGREPGAEAALEHLAREAAERRGKEVRRVLGDGSASGGSAKRDLRSVRRDVQTRRCRCEPPTVRPVFSVRLAASPPARNWTQTSVGPRASER